MSLLKNKKNDETINKIINTENLMLRLSDDQKSFYTQLFNDYAINGKVRREDFYPLLGMLGTQIAGDFADRIFMIFSSSKKDITLCEYLKYIDIFHCGDNFERSRVTCKLIDYKNKGYIELEDLKSYIYLIIKTVKKVNPIVSSNTLMTDQDIECLFYHISHGKKSFTYEEFENAYLEKPEIISWFDYFKNDTEDILLIIHENLNKLINLVNRFLAEFIRDIFDLREVNEYTLLPHVIQKILIYNEEVLKIKKNFAIKINKYTFRSTFDIIQKHKYDVKELLNTLKNDDNEDKINTNISTKENLNNDMEFNNNANIVKFFENVKNSLYSRKSNKENIEKINRKISSFYKEAGKELNKVILNNNNKRKNFLNNNNNLNINKASINDNFFNNIHNLKNRSVSERIPKFNQINNLNNFNNGIKNSLYTQQIYPQSPYYQPNNIKQLLSIFRLIFQNSFGVVKIFSGCYKWIIDHYLGKQIKSILKEQATYKKRKIIKKMNLGNKARKINPVKAKIISPQNKSFKILLNMIIGIEIAVQAAPSILIKNNEDINYYRRVMKYSLQKISYNKYNEEEFSLLESNGIIFNNIRLYLGISKSEFISSINPQDLITEIMISSQTIFEELCSTGSSGSLLYYTRDGKYIVKTIPKKEFEFLDKILPSYYLHLKKYPISLLPKYLGCYCLKSKIKNNKKKFYFIVMMNVFATMKHIDIRFDLKGSKIGRKVLTGTEKDNEILAKDGVSLKDLDFEKLNIKINMGPKKTILMKQIENDAEFLRQNNVNDYSLLFGIHYNQKLDSNLNNSKNNIIENNDLFSEKTYNDDISSNYSCGKESVSTHNSSADNRMKIIKELFDFNDGGILSENGKEIYYFGMIDILTEFNCKKKMEYLAKKLRYCSENYSCIHPDNYKSRFVNYINLVFENKVKNDYNSIQTSQDSYANFNNN